MDNFYISDTFAKIARELIALNRYNFYLNYSRMKKQGLSPEHICFELGTVALNCARRTGKTRFIHDHFDDNSIVIVWGEGVKRRMLKEYPKLKRYKNNIVVTCDLVHEKYYACTQYKTIYIDEPFSFKGNILKLAYKCFAKTGEELFIVMGASK
jgi:hypothetical protein